jgi:ABC-type lipoprotein release transport system permease subunit
MAGGALGVGLGFGILLSFRQLMLHYLKLPYLFPDAPELAVLTVAAVAIALVTGLLAALAPAWSAVRREPYEAIRSAE